MKRKLTAILILLGIMICTAGTAVWAESAAAQSENEITAELVLPTSYEQYLELKSPTDFAVSEKYIAVADKTSASEAVIYIYDKAEKSYKTCRIQTTDKISSLNFYSCSSGEYLFYILPPNALYSIKLDADTLSPEKNEQITPSVLLIHDNRDIYYSTQTGSSSMLFYSSFDGDLNILPGTQIGDTSLETEKPAFSEYDGQVYVSANKNIYPCDSDNYYTETPIVTQDSIYNFAIFGKSSSQIMYSNAGNRLYYGDGENPIADNCSIIKYFDGKLFVLYGDGISQFDTASGTFTAYRIDKYSDNQNRIGKDASDISLWGKHLAIADKENRRVVLYDTTDMAGGIRTVDDLNFLPQILCAGKNSFAVSDSFQVRLYDYEGTLLKTVPSDSFSSTVRGIAYSYGTYYIVAEGNMNACKLTEDGEFVSGKNSDAGTSVTADIFGNIYILNGDKVYRYTSENFGKQQSGEFLIKFSAAPDKILADYAGNIYALTSDAIFRFKTDKFKTDKSPAEEVNISEQLNALVFNQSASSAVSFALGFESDEIYILSDGFIAKTDSLNVASLGDLSAAQTYESIFDTLPSADFAQDRLVTAQAGCVSIRLDYSAMQARPASLPCGEFSLVTSERTGIVLARTEHGVIALFYEHSEDGIQTSRNYEICLLPTGSNFELLGDRYYTEKSYSASVSNEIGLYKYPAMHVGSDGAFRGLGELQRLERGTTVDVIGELAPDAGILDAGTYAFVSISQENGETYGFIPLRYLVERGESAARDGSFVYRNLAEDAVVTLKNGENSVTLENRERVRAYGEADANNQIFVIYTDENGNSFYGRIDASLLEQENNSIIAVLVIVPLVTAVVLFSVCYLILRKQPTLQ